MISVSNCQVRRAWGHWKKRCVESWVGWLHKVHFGESMIFMLKSLLFVMQLFLKILYWRSLASIALVVLDSLMMCCSSCAGGMLWSVENLLNLAQHLGSNEELLMALKKCAQPFRLGLVSSIFGGKRGHSCHGIGET